jgi:hypothetical protein
MEVKHAGGRPNGTVLVESARNEAAFNRFTQTFFSNAVETKGVGLGIVYVTAT